MSEKSYRILPIMPTARADAAVDTVCTWPQCSATTRARPSSEGTEMINVKTIDDLAQRLSAMVPPGVSAAREELTDNFRAALRSGLSRLDLVSRDEFDIQRAVLLRTREKIDLLERMVADLERRLDEMNAKTGDQGKG